jgi:hypothetical protein
MKKKIKINSKGRASYTFSLKEDVMIDFRTHCIDKGYALSKRIEVLLKNDLGIKTKDGYKFSRYEAGLQNKGYKKAIDDVLKLLKQEKVTK